MHKHNLRFFICVNCRFVFPFVTAVVLLKHLNKSLITNGIFCKCLNKGNGLLKSLLKTMYQNMKL